MASPSRPRSPHTAYTVNSKDLVTIKNDSDGNPQVSGSAYRLNIILQSINGRIGDLESSSEAAKSASGNVFNISSTSAIIPATAIPIVVNYTLTFSRIITSPGVPADGVQWIAFIMQDAVGGWAVTWGPGIMLGPQINGTINGDPLTMCIVPFIGNNGKWYPMGLPVLGVPIV
jgi:hypothetical protein